MRLFQLGSAAALASVGSTLLIPPTINSVDTDILNKLPLENIAEADQRVFAVDCHECPVPVTDVDGVFHVLKPSKLQFSLAVAHDEQDTLTLNGMQIYPVVLSPKALTIPLLIETDDDNWQQVDEPTGGFTLQINHPLQESDDQLLDLISISLDINELSDHPVTEFPTIDIKLLEAAGGKLMIGNPIELVPQSTVSDDSECTTGSCKLRVILAEKLSKLQGSGGKDGHLSDPEPHDEYEAVRFFKNELPEILLYIVVGIFTVVVFVLTLGACIAAVIVFCIVFVKVATYLTDLAPTIYRAFFRSARSGCGDSGLNDHVAEIPDEDGEKVCVINQDESPKYGEVHTSENQHLLADENDKRVDEMNQVDKLV